MQSEYCDVVFDAWGALSTLEIFHGIIKILNYWLWSLPSQPVGLIELLTQNLLTQNLLTQNLILSAYTNTIH